MFHENLKKNKNSYRWKRKPPCSGFCSLKKDFLLKMEQGQAQITVIVIMQITVPIMILIMITYVDQTGHHNGIWFQTMAH